MQRGKRMWISIFVMICIGNNMFISAGEDLIPGYLIKIGGVA